MKEGIVVKKTRVLSLLLILAMALSLTLSAAAYADGEKNDWKGIVWERDSLLDALFIRGVGVLPVEQPMPWQSDAARNVAVCFDDGVTEIPAGFTAGCVNMKTVMIPASVRSIGQGVLAISGGLKDVYYQGTLQGLLSIQMFPEDRAALNGAVFHGSKIVYDENGNFEYVPAEDGETGKMEVKQDGTVTVTHNDGTTTTYTYERHYDESGKLVSEEYHSGTEDFYIGYTYWDNGKVKTITTEHHAHYPVITVNESNEKVETMIDSVGYLTEHYTRDGVLERTVFRNGNEKIVTEYVRDGDIERIETITKADGSTYYTHKVYVDGTSIREYDYELPSGVVAKRTDHYDADDNLRQVDLVYTDEGGVPDPDSGKMLNKQVAYYDNGKMTGMENYFVDGSTAQTEVKGNSYRTTYYDKDGKRTEDTTVIPGNQQYTQHYAEDGNTVTSIHIEWLGSNTGHTADITYNADGSYTRVDTYPDNTTQTRYFDKDGNETTATGSPIV